MQYKGKLYGKVGNGYFPLSLSADEVDLFCGFGGTTTGFADVPAIAFRQLGKLGEVLKKYNSS